MNNMAQSLVEEKAFINNEWVEAADGARFTVTNPATGEVVAQPSSMSGVDTEKAIRAASKAFPSWRNMLASERAALLEAWHDLIVEHADMLAELLTCEQGKPRAEAHNEVLYAASFVKWNAAEARRIYGDIVPSHRPSSKALILKQPVGVCAAITPWNFPYAMITRKTAPALAAGCPMIVKPAAETPVTALALARLAEKAGFPPGVFNVLPGNKPAEIAETLMKSPCIAKLSFTGSTRIGKLLIRQSADTVKKLTMELGGHAPFIVFDDADVEKAADGLLASKFRNAGQTCVCPNRIFVQEKIADAFIQAVTDRVSKLKVGNGLEKGVEQGPLINEKAVLKAEEHIKDAVSKGAKLLCGGKRHELGNFFFEPSVLSHVDKSMLINTEETFGPVAPIEFFTEEDDVIARANDTEYGLASYLYTSDLGRAFRLVDALDYGMVGVNESILGGDAVPFGGFKQSGIGREGSKYGIEEYIEIKYALIGGLGK